MLSRPQSHIAAGILVTSTGIEPATFGNAKQSLKQLRHPVLPDNTKTVYYFHNTFFAVLHVSLFDVIFES